MGGPNPKTEKTIRVHRDWLKSRGISQRIPGGGGPNLDQKRSVGPLEDFVLRYQVGINSSPGTSRASKEHIKTPTIISNYLNHQITALLPQPMTSNDQNREYIPITQIKTSDTNHHPNLQRKRTQKPRVPSKTKNNNIINNYKYNCQNQEQRDL
mmetsp:Transcript_24723/g.29879  ORF Transcript_24723/g.29879 Transcript_24723/m.29879 type:complete len:154 (+) Transcript_24723:523-984(+)